MKQATVPTADEGAQLVSLASRTEAEIAGLTAEIAPLQARLDAAKEKLDLIRRLIHLGNPGGVIGDVGPEGSSRPRHVGGGELEDRIEQILASGRAPMHISDIREALIKGGVPLPGRGNEANIILRLRRAPGRFTRTGRGVYGLTAWNLVPYSPAPRTRRVRRQRKTQ